MLMVIQVYLYVCVYEVKDYIGRAEHLKQLLKPNSDESHDSQLTSDELGNHSHCHIESFLCIHNECVLFKI